MRIATLNLRNTADRWPERRHLLVRQLVDLAPDVIGVQELRVVPDQARWLVRAVARQSAGGLRYRAYRQTKGGVAGLWEGIGVLAAARVVATAGLDLGAQARVAQRVTVRMPQGGLLDIYNTHLGLGGEVLRAAQAQRILDWMDRRPPLPAVLMGDLNARPGSPTIELLSTRLRSAHLVAHGQEPARTVPTPLRLWATGDGSVLDYVFVNDRLEVRDARIVFDQCDDHDPTLVASDHYGLSVTVAPR
ncbi:MAG TPA: endonuclease/exonuclease/phosphatase family protein [Acidimicrobiales bacterium]|nr:endonuclease/exonuclease/phosphatase family protein [Acidimicrobiales bacterium]